MAATAEALRRLDELRQQRVLLGADELVLRRPTTAPTGLATLDELLGGGLPEGKVLVLDGVAGAPLGALSLQVLASFTQRERLVAVVDRGEGFDPASAAEAGVALDRLLVCRPTQAAAAVKAAHVLLASGAFAVVVLDLREPGRGGARAPTRTPATVVPAPAPVDDEEGFVDASPRLVRFAPGDPSSPLVPRRRVGREAAIGSGAWLRLSRDAEATRSRLLVLGGDGGAGSFAAATLSLGRPRVRWLGHGPGRTLEGVQVVVALAHNRLGLPPGRATLLFDAPAAFPDVPHGSAAGSTAGTPGGTAAGRKITPSPIKRGLRTSGTRRAASLPRALTAPHARPASPHEE